jgi:disulfide bond formation protein DsbB
MVTHAAIRPAIATEVAAPADRIGGISAIALGVTGFVYSVSFIVVKNDALTAAMLAASGLLTLALFSALYERLRAGEPSLARLALILGMIGASGALIHGGYDLANAINPPATPNLDLPSAIDPRGLLTFGIGGIAVALVAALIGRNPATPRALPWLGFVTAALMLVLYFGRLIILDATHPLVVAAALLTGFLVSPLWNIWLGATLLRERQD